MVVSPSSNDFYSEVQAWAAVAAILAGFIYVGVQRWLETAAAGRAAGRLARHSIDFATSRLEALIDASRPTEFALRGARATEMIEVFRELEISRLPSSIIESVAVIRSSVYAMNVRIDDVLKDDATRRDERRSRLYSAGRTLTQAREELNVLRGHFMAWNRSALVAAPLRSNMTIFLQEAEQARKKS